MNVNIPSNSLIPAISTAIQRLLVLALGYFGIALSNDSVVQIASAIVSGGLIIWGAYKSYSSNEDKKTLDASPAGAGTIK